MELLGIVMGFVMLAALAAVYAIAIRSMDGRQPGEDIVDRVFALIEKRAAEAPAPTAASPAPVVPTLPSLPTPAVILPPSLPLPMGAPKRGRHPWSNAPAGMADVDVASGFPLYYPGVNADGEGVPAGAPWYVYAPGMTAQTPDEAKLALARDPQRTANLTAVEAAWKAARFDGPIVAAWMAVGDAAYAANRAAEYGIATGGRDLFRDLLSGTNTEIALARHNGEWNRNQGHPYAEATAAAVDALFAQHRKG
jgi:hypothetical protein